MRSASKTRKVKVVEYRDLIAAVSQWRTSLLSAATADEQRHEAASLRNAAEELRSARCPSASAHNRQKAAQVLADANSLLARKKAEFDAADAALSRMAFAAEWK